VSAKYTPGIHSGCDCQIKNSVAQLNIIQINSADLSLSYLMNIEAASIEPVNQRRGGWSSVIEVQIDGQNCYLKRQFNHRYIDPKKGFRRLPTMLRELNGYQLLKEIDVGTPELIYSAHDGHNAVLVVSALNAHHDLCSFLTNSPSADQRRDILNQLTQTIIKLHENQLTHGCLYGNHIFLRSNQTDPDIRLLDLEKLSRPIRWHQGVTRDLDQLFRHTPQLTESEQSRILQQYQQSFTWFKVAWHKRRPD